MGIRGACGNVGGRYGQLDKIAWYEKKSGGCTQNIGGKQPNAWGFHDMPGNVFEWVEDGYGGRDVGFRFDGN